MLFITIIDGYIEPHSFCVRMTVSAALLLVTQDTAEVPMQRARGKKQSSLPSLTSDFKNN